MSEERKRDLIENERERFQEALDDLAIFVKKHGCIPAFKFPEAFVHLTFNTDEEAIDQMVDVIRTRWSYDMFDGEKAKEQQSKDVVFAEDASEPVREQKERQARIDAVGEKLGPGAMLEAMARIASGEDPDLILSSLEDRAAQVDSQQREVEENPELKLADFESGSQSEEEALDDMFDEGDDDSDILGLFDDEDEPPF